VRKAWKLSPPKPKSQEEGDNEPEHGRKRRVKAHKGASEWGGGKEKTGGTSSGHVGGERKVD